MKIIKKILGVILIILGLIVVQIVNRGLPFDVNEFIKLTLHIGLFIVVVIGIVGYFFIICWLLIGEDDSDDQML